MDLADALPYSIEWIHPDRPLTSEIIAALKLGYLRSVDLWQIAVALYRNERISGTLAFITPGRRQQAVTAIRDCQLDARRRRWR